MGVVTEMKTTEVIPNRGNHSADDYWWTLY